MVLSSANELLRAPDVLHHVGQTRFFANTARMLEKPYAKFRVRMIFLFKKLHAMHRELLAGRGGADEIESLPAPVMRSLQRKVENVLTDEDAPVWDLSRAYQINPNTLPSTGSECLRPAKSSAKKIQHSHGFELSFNRAEAWLVLRSFRWSFHRFVNPPTSIILQSHGATSKSSDNSCAAIRLMVLPEDLERL